MKEILIQKATYIEGYKIALRFNDGKEQTVDFEHFLSSSSNPHIRKYLKIDAFKTFELDHGDLQWNDYDLCFPVADLYDNTIECKHSGLEQVS